MRITARAWLFAIAWLVLLEIALRITPMPVPRDFRMPDRRTDGLEQQLQALQASEGARIALVGDSVVWGTLAASDDSLSFHMDHALTSRDGAGRAASFGLSGAHANDYLPVVARISEQGAADLIVLQFDPRFFSVRESRKFRYPALYSAVSDARVAARYTSESTSAEGQGIARFLGMSRVWEYRGYPAAALLDGLPPKAAVGAMIRWVDDGPRSYRKKTADELPHSKIRKMYDIPPYSPDDPYFVDLGIALDVARDNDLPVLVFSGPVDRSILDSERLWDPTAYEANLDVAARFVESHGGTFLDLSDTLPAEEIGDTHHPLGAGYRRLAATLLEHIRPDGSVRR